MANSANNSTAAVTSHMARALKNSFLWNHKLHMTEILGGQGPKWPESKAGREAWTAFYVEFAEYLNNQFGYEAVSNTLDYLVKTKKDGDEDHAVSLLIGRPWGPTAAPTAALTAAPTAQPAQPALTDPKAMLTQAFLAGTISVESFTQAVAALDGAAAAPAPTAKPKLEVVQPEPEAEAEAEAEAESSPLPTPVVIPVAYEADDDDLPF